METWGCKWLSWGHIPGWLQAQGRCPALGSLHLCPLQKWHPHPWPLREKLLQGSPGGLSLEILTLTLRGRALESGLSQTSEGASETWEPVCATPRPHQVLGLLLPPQPPGTSMPSPHLEDSEWTVVRGNRLITRSGHIYSTHIGWDPWSIRSLWDNHTVLSLRTSIDYSSDKALLVQ